MRHSDGEFNTAENEGECRGGSLLSAVGLWVRGPKETFSLGYWASSQVLTFPFISLR